MVLHRVKSHVHLQGLGKQSPQEHDEHHVESAKPNNIAHIPDKASRVYTFSTDSDDPIYELDIGPVEEAGFSKKPASTIQDRNVSRTFRAEPHIAETLVSSFHPESLHSFPNPTIDDCDPSDSLLIQAPLYIPGPEDDEAATPSKSGSAVKQGKSNYSSQSWHDWFVALFAGRKAKPATHNHQSKNSSSVCSPVSAQLAPQPQKTNSNQESKHAARPPQPPQLLLSQIIPRIHVSRIDRTFRRTAYRRILPAPITPFTGYAVVAKDEYIPGIVIHGFDTPRRPSSTSVSRGQSNSAANLLDRNGDAWAIWNRRNTTAADIVFARTHSDPGYPAFKSKENAKHRTQYQSV